uniref:transposase n=1 Tax=Nonomuraea pusilla TaxID=46177 RepID=UPI000AB78699
MGADRAASPGPEHRRPEKHSRRDIVDPILYVVRTGCAWRQLPFDLPPWQTVYWYTVYWCTVYWYFVRWEKAKVTEEILASLRRRVRTAQGRAEEPSAGIVDSQSVRAPTPSAASREGVTRARRSTVGSGSSSPTPSACCWSCA